MRSLRNLGYRLAPVLIFLAGIVVGVAISGIWVAARLTEFVEEGPGSIARTGSELVMRKLELTARQREELAPLIGRVEAAFVAMHREDLARVRVLFEDAAREIRPHLREDQRAILDEMMIAPRRRWEKFLGTPPNPTATPPPETPAETP